MASNDIQRGIVDENLGTDSKLDLGLPGNELSPDAAPTIQVAQADTGAEETATVAATENPATITIELEDGPVVHLPEGTSIDTPRQNGADLEFVQPDGSVVVIAGGAVTGLTIFIGDIQIPPDGVQAIFDANGIEPAEGPGQGPAGDSHGNFDDVPIGNVGAGLNIGDLLPPTELLFGTPGRFEEFAITPPVMLIGAGFVEEDDLSAVRGDLSDGNNEDGSFGAQTFSGTLVSDFGSGGAHPTNALSFTGSPPEGLTSQGEPITYTIVDSDYGQILQAFASSGGEDEPRLVFELELIVSGNTGSYTFTLYDQLDHALTDDPDTGAVETAFEDILALGFGIEAQNASGATSDGTLNIGVQDDIPVYLGEGANYYVDEDDIDTDPEYSQDFYVDGHHFYVQDGSLGTSPQDGAFWDGSYTDSPSNTDPGPAYIFGSMANLFSVGSDEFPEERPQDEPKGESEYQYETAAVFVSPSSSGGAAFALTADGLANIEALGLTSNSEGLAYYLAENGDGSFSLFGYVPGSSPQDEGNYRVAIAEEGSEEIAISDEASGRLVFKLDVDSNGDFEFRLFDQLDHSDPGVGTVGAPVEDLISLDFSSLVTVTDYDGDTIGAPEGAFVINVRDDVPELVEAEPVSLVLDEDDIHTELSLGTEIEDGNGDGSYTGPAGTTDGGPATAEADISGLVNGGADEELTFSFLPTDVLRTYLEGLGLMSQGRPIGFDLQTDGTIIGFVNALGGAVPGQTYDVDEGDRQIFEITLSEDGHVKVELYDQLDHIAPESGADQNQTLESEGHSQFNLGDVIIATDHDGDSVLLGSQVTISVTDDVPVLSGDRIFRTVDEDDIQNDQSLGTSPQDGNADGSFTENPGDNAPGAATVSGSLSGLVQSGADEGLTFSFINESSIRASLESLGLTSQGGPLSYDVQGDTLYAFVNADAPGVIYNEGQDRLVFELIVDENGNYEFKLHDQLDHDAPGDDYPGPDPLSDQNFDLQDTVFGDVRSIDFGQFIEATDYDGDSVVLENSLSIQVRDDVPVIAEGAEQVSITVDEDDIATYFSRGTEIEDGNSDGSFTGPAGFSVGGPANASGTLAGLVQSGADESLTYGFTANAVTGMLAQNIDSQGRNISYEVVGNTLYAFINAGAPGNIGSVYNEGQDQLVFTLEVDPDTGEFTFSLHDQLDHATGNGQNSLDIDFGSVLQATDYDGDSVVLNALVNVTVTDDVPVLVKHESEVQIVDEQEIDTSWSEGTQPDPYPDGFDGNDSYTTSNGGAARVTGSLSHLVQSGADENLTFSFVSNAQNIMQGLGLTSQGGSVLFVVNGNQLIGYVEEGGIPGFSAQYDRPVLTLTLNEDGSYTFDLIDQLDHDAPSHGADENFDLEVPGPDIYAIDFGDVITATDYDGDSVTLGDAFRIQVKDDVPELVKHASEVQIVDEQEIDTTLSQGTQPDSYPDGIDGNDSYTTSNGGAARVTGSLLHLVQSGADENLTFSFVSNAQNIMQGLGLTSQGASVLFVVEGNQLIGYVEEGGIPGYSAQHDRPVLKLTLNEDGSYTFDLIDQLDHDAPNSGADENFDLEVPGPDIYAIDFGDVIKATDHDGDSVILGDTFRIQVKDDVPVLVRHASEVQIVDEQEINTTLSQGTQPDPYPDGIDGNDSYTSYVSGSDGSAKVNGSLSHLVESGADENLTFEFTGNAASAMAGLGLTSHGAELHFVVQGNDLIAYAEEGGIPGYSEQYDRTVFKLTVNENGDYTFQLYDQMDHDAPNSGADENFDLEVPGPDIYAIDFGDVIKATDYDGDSIILGDAFRIQVKDDVPEIVDNPVTASGTVSEGDIAEGLPTLEAFEHSDSASQSYSGQNFDFVIDAPVTDQAGTLHVVVAGDISGQAGEYFSVIVEGTTFGPFTGSSPGVTSSGPYGPYDGQYHTLILDIPLSAADLATWTADGQIDLTIDLGPGVDDLGWNPGVSYTLSYDYPVATVTPDTADVDLSGLVAVGADDEITFSLTSFAETAFGSYTSDGEQIMISSDGDVLTGMADGEMVFTLTVTPEGYATFSLYGEFDHGAADPMPLDLGAFVQATDFDGDTIGLGANLFVINVEDGGDPLDISGSISGTVEEEHLSPQMQAAYPVTADGIDDEDDDSPVADDDDVDPDFGITDNVTSGVLSTDLTITGVDGTLNFGFAGVSEGGNVSMNGGGNLTSGGEAVLFHMIDATHIVGYVEAGGTGDYDGGTDQVVFSLDITDATTGAYTFTLFDKVDHHPIASADDVEDSIGIDFGGLIQVSDVGDSGDTATIDNFVVDVIDDVPEALPSSAQVDEGTVQPINAALVLDYSGSITGTQLNQMLTAVKAAGLQLFSSPGDVSITVVAFANGADTLGTFTSYAAFEAAIDATNEAELHLRPVNAYGTNYTAAIDELVNNSGYTPVSGESNQIFFLSDGAPDRGMDGSNVLESGTASAWDAFVNGAIDINVTAIGVGENINTANLQQVDIDGTGAPIMVDDFDDLVDALLGAIVPSGASGNVITDSVGTAFGADGGHVLSIAHDGVTYTYDPDAGTITSSGGSAGTDAGSGVLELATALGGTLTFDFTSGEWSYAGPASGVTSNTDEVFSYTLIDGDGDTASADLTITVVPGNAAPVANDDVVLTNVVDGSDIVIPSNAMLYNDTDADGDPLTTDVDEGSASGGTVVDGSAVFTPALSPEEDASVTITVDGNNNSSNDDYLNFAFTGGSATDRIQSITINLRAGSDNNAIFDPLPGNGDFGIDISNLNGLALSDISIPNPDQQGSMTINFDSGTFAVGDSFDLNVKIDSLGNEQASEWASRGVEATILLEDGRTQTVTFSAVDGDTSAASFALESADLSFTSGSFEYVANDGDVDSNAALVSITGVDSDTISGTDADEILIAKDGVLVERRVDAAVSSGNVTNAGSFSFSFVSAAVLGEYIDGITIDLSGTPGIFDQISAGGGYSKAFSLDGGAIVAVAPSIDTQTLEISFAPGTFTVGETLEFSIDVDGMSGSGGGSGSDFVSIPFSVTFSDGQTLAGVYGSDGSGGAQATVSETINVGSTLIGGGGDDFLVGGDGDDILFGDAGNDVLDGGLGSDTMTGGADADTFVISADTVGLDILDVITDYSAGEGDVVDLSDLFSVGTGEDVADFVQYDDTTGMIQVDQDGSAGGSNFVDVVDIGTGLAGTINIIFDDDGTDTSGTI